MLTTGHIYAEWGETLGYDSYVHYKVTASAIFSTAMRKAFVRARIEEMAPESGGHDKHKPIEAYSLQEIEKFLRLFPGGQIAVTIGLKASCIEGAPELEALTPDELTVSACGKIPRAGYPPDSGSRYRLCFALAVTED